MCSILSGLPLQLWHIATANTPSLAQVRHRPDPTNDAKDISRRRAIDRRDVPAQGGVLEGDNAIVALHEERRARGVWLGEDSSTCASQRRIVWALLGPPTGNSL